jgi:NAD(P)-dependent dehydrogenase (short-subunit alcohol dehydrogenase family)
VTPQVAAATQPVAVVTGASRGIGHHLAEALGDHGYVVERGSRAVADVTDRDAVEAWVADIVGRHGRVDLLVNNAGVIDAEVPLEDSDPDDWWSTVATNVLGPYLVTRAVLPHMLAARSGRVVNLNSGAGVRPSDVATAYNVSKTALARLTGSTHLSGLDRGVFAFDLAPGVVRTDMTLAMQAHHERTDWTEPQQVSALVLAMGDGRLDAWSGRMVRAGADTVESLVARAADGLRDVDRTITLVPWGDTDPLG